MKKLSMLLLAFCVVGFFACDSSYESTEEETEEATEEEATMEEPEEAEPETPAEEAGTGSDDQAGGGDDMAREAAPVIQAREVSKAPVKAPVASSTDVKTKVATKRPAKPVDRVIIKEGTGSQQSSQPVKKAD